MKDEEKVEKKEEVTPVKKEEPKQINREQNRTERPYRLV